MAPKVRVMPTKPFHWFSTEGGYHGTEFLPGGKMVMMTAEEIFAAMSKDPRSLTVMNPTAPTLSEEEKAALDELLDLLKAGALENENADAARNCLEILSSPLGLLHPRRLESVEMLKQALAIPELEDFSGQLIVGSKKMLRSALDCGDEKTMQTAKELLAAFGE